MSEDLELEEFGWIRPANVPISLFISEPSFSFERNQSHIALLKECRQSLFFDAYKHVIPNGVLISFRCFQIGRAPRPILLDCLKALIRSPTYRFASLTLSSTLFPSARHEAIAADKVQPEP